MDERQEWTWPEAALAALCCILPSVCLAQQAEDAQSQPATAEKTPEQRDALAWFSTAPLSGSLATDRPGYSDTAFLVPRGHVQYEMGLGFACEVENRSRTRTISAGTAALRLGLLDEFELRIKWGGMSLVDTRYPDKSPAGRSYMNHESIDGATDMSLGSKSPILKHSDMNYLPNISIVPSISLPTGTLTKTSGDVDPTLEIAWNYPVTDRLTVYGIGTITSITDSAGRLAQGSASAAVSYALTSRMSLFAEYFGIYPNARNSDCQHSINGGPVFLINDNMQVDFAIGLGLNEEAPDFFANVGFSIRL